MEMLDSHLAAPPAVESETTRRRAFRALLFLVPAPSLGTALGLVLTPGTVVGQLGFAASKVWIALFPLFWLLYVERAPLSWSGPRRGGLGMGALLGLVIGAVIVGAYFSIGPLLIDTARVRTMAIRAGLGTPGVFLAGAAYWITANSLIEEYVWRWFVFRQCERLMAARTAIFLSAFFFTMHHIVALHVYLDWFGVALTCTGVFVGGAAWSWCYRRYRSIWPGYVSHAIVDLAIFWIAWRLIFAD